MTRNQQAFIEKLLLTSAISPSTRATVRQMVAEGMDHWKTTQVIQRLCTITETAVPREQRMAEWRVASLCEKVAFYGRRGDKPVIKPLVADLEWLAQQRRPVSPETTHTAPTRHGRKEAA